MKGTKTTYASVAGFIGNAPHIALTYGRPCHFASARTRRRGNSRKSVGTRTSVRAGNISPDGRDADRYRGRRCLPPPRPGRWRRGVCAWRHALRFWHRSPTTRVGLAQPDFSCRRGFDSTRLPIGPAASPPRRRVRPAAAWTGGAQLSARAASAERTSGGDDRVCEARACPFSG